MHISKMARGLVVLATSAALASACDGRHAEDPVGMVMARDSTVGVNYNQNDEQWACKQLGTCRGTTLGKCGGTTPAGCAVAVLSDVLESRGDPVDPGALNAWLIDNSGYADGCNVVWNVAARHGGLSFVGSDRLTTPAVLKALLDEGKAVIVKSSRFSPHSQHWVVVSGYSAAGDSWSDFGYSDPWDATSRNVGDGWVRTGAETRVFQ